MVYLNPKGDGKVSAGWTGLGRRRVELDVIAYRGLTLTPAQPFPIPPDRLLANEPSWPLIDLYVLIYINC